MKEGTTTCYMCGASASGREHVPPRCFFPRSRDRIDGQDFRTKLQTVQSCNIHNSGKSKDDEYFLNVVTSLESINEVGRNHYRNQIRRQNERNPSILARFAGRAVEVDGRFGHEIEISRVDSFVDHFARGLYFLHYSKKWQEEVRWFPEFLARPPPHSEEETTRVETIQKNNQLFHDAGFHGSNPDVFKYQVVESLPLRRIRVHFYEGCKFYLEFQDAKRPKHNKALRRTSR
ncbi:MAG: hypothetical protein SVU69_09505 [Pseudomonadota bacterium]|nr:hypothetical protein [Pseudomonadota bacterium]